VKDQSSNRELRRFAFTVGTGLAIVGALSRFRGHTEAPTVLWFVGGILWLLGLVQPGSLRPIKKAWMGLAHVLGWVNTRIILGLLFYLVLTPISIVMRFFHDPLDRRLHEVRKSYWISKKSQSFDPKNYEKQF